MIKKIFFLVILITFLTRFIGLSQIPNALNRDEAAIGYNAYSILETGKDEHGQSLPFNFESIGDYKMPLYIYLTTLPVKAFGLNEFSIKFFSALAGSLSVVAVYFLTKKLLDSKTTALIAAGLMALNPWAIFYSRVGFEANLSLAFFLVGLNLWLSSKVIPQLFGVILFLLAGLTYSSSLIFLPLIVASLFIYKYKSIRKNPRSVIPYFIYLLLFALEFYLLWSTSSNKSTISIFSNPTLIDQFNTLRVQTAQIQPLWAKFWLNRPFYLARLFSFNYLQTFSPKFLLLQGGGHPWHRIPGLGNFYLIEIIYFIYGFFHLLKSKRVRPFWKMVLLVSWLVLAPIASAITIDAPHSTRSLHLLPIVIIISAYGLSHFFSKSKSKLLKATVIIVYLLNFIYASYQYTYTYRRTVYQDIPVGLAQTLKEIDPHQYNQIYFYHLDDFAYLYPALYYHYSPADFQINAIWSPRDLIGLTHVESFGNFKIIYELKDLIHQSLIIAPNATIINDKPIFFNNQHFTVYLVE